MALLHFTVYYLSKMLSFHVLRMSYVVHGATTKMHKAALLLSVFLRLHIKCVHISFSIESSVEITVIMAFHSKGFSSFAATQIHVCNMMKLLLFFFYSENTLQNLLNLSFEWAITACMCQARKKCRK